MVLDEANLTDDRDRARLWAAAAGRRSSKWTTQDLGFDVEDVGGGVPLCVAHVTATQLVQDSHRHCQYA